jgi:2-polyprenyl-3-methyl-5-hydroxy-6-metoxy-1,4-benzoquinol methylase
MDQQGKTISWGEHLPKYKVPTILKETLLKPFFKSLSLKEPIVDLGCGTGYFSEIITETGKKVLGIDKNGDVASSDNFSFQRQDILDFQSQTLFKTILLINILSVESPTGRKAIIKKVHELLDEQGLAYILTTSSKLFDSPTNSDLISFDKLSVNKVHLKAKLTNGDYIDFDDFIVPEEETRLQISETGLEIIKEKELQHPYMDRPVYILYIVKKR